VTIELSPQLESALANEAARRGTTPAALVAEIIESQLPAMEATPATEPPLKPDEGTKGRTLYDRWKEHLEAVEAASAEARGPTNLSQDTGRRFTELLQQRREQGRL